MSTALVDILAILAGVGIGTGLALVAGLLLRRRRPARGSAQTAIRGARPSLLGTAAQRTRALWMAVGISLLATVLALSGASAWAGVLTLLAVLLAGQSLLFAFIARLREGRRPG